jgi:copper chaperone CopZ
MQLPCCLEGGIVRLSKLESVNMKVAGMSCHHCEVRLTTALLRVPGVKDAHASANDSEVQIVFDIDKAGIEQLREAINDCGYTPV